MLHRNLSVGLSIILLRDRGKNVMLKIAAFQYHDPFLEIFGTVLALLRKVKRRYAHCPVVLFIRFLNFYLFSEKAV